MPITVRRSAPSCRGLALVCLLSCSIAAAQETAGVDFSRQIRPILADHCLQCHGPDEEAREAELRLDTRAGAFTERDGSPLVVPGRPAASELFRRLTAADDSERMPPVESSKRLTEEQIELMRRWIAEGATWEEHWAFTPPRRPAPPDQLPSAWVRNDIDRFVMSGLAQREVSPRRDAPPQVLARRLSLDLTGLPLPLPELDRFLEKYAQDAESAVEGLVDRLLASPRYGVHWAWMWMDAARYADTSGFQTDRERTMWRWRDWLVEALNANVPFDDLTVRMLAGDLLVREAGGADAVAWESGDLLRDSRDTDTVLATGFLRNHRYDTGSGTIPDESRFENSADRMETTATVFMGLTMQCARCHAHKFDPITNREYYELLAFFDKTPEFGSAISPNPHPYLVTPTADQWPQVRQADQAVAEALRNLRAAEPRLAAAQADWERTRASLVEEEVRVARGLRFHFPLTGPDARLTAPVALARLDAGSRGTALLFDGETTLQGSLEPGRLCAGAKHWTVSLWFRLEAGDDQTLLSVVEKPETNRNGIQIDLSGGKLRLRHVGRWHHSVIELISRESITAGSWQHVAFACDGRMQGIAYEAWLNGEPNTFVMTRESTNDNAASGADAPLVIGGGPFLPWFRGGMADVRFYDRDLRPQEIAMLADPRSIAEVVAIAAPRRTDHDRLLLRQHFLEYAAPEELRALQRAVFDAEAALAGCVAGLPTTMVMQDDSGRPATHVRLKGAYDQWGEAVSPGTPGILPPLGGGEEANRLTLARWLVSGEHPLTARVAVNRIWQQLFGVGFVETPENFGTQCARPEQADVLDWLATEYVRLGWDTQALIKTIVLSSTYRQDSSAAAELWARDPENRWLARGPRHRLPIATIRDQALAWGGLLDEAFRGEPVKLWEPPSSESKSNAKRPSAQPVPYCRTLYTYWKRNETAPLLAVFDTADRNLCTVAVRRTNTPLQALVTLNELGFFAAAGAFGQRIIDAGGESDGARLEFAFRLVTADRPTSQEREVLEAALRDYRGRFATNSAAARDLVASAGLNPSKLDRNAELAAWITLSNVLLNLDRTLTKE